MGLLVGRSRNRNAVFFLFFNFFVFLGFSNPTACPVPLKRRMGVIFFVCSLPHQVREFSSLSSYQSRVHHDGVAGLGQIDGRLKRGWLGVVLVAENLDLLVKEDTTETHTRATYSPYILELLCA